MSVWVIFMVTAINKRILLHQTLSTQENLFYLMVKVFKKIKNIRPRRDGAIGRLKHHWKNNFKLVSITKLLKYVLIRSHEIV